MFSKRSKAHMQIMDRTMEIVVEYMHPARQMLVSSEIYNKMLKCIYSTIDEAIPRFSDIPKHGFLYKEEIDKCSHLLLSEMLFNSLSSGNFHIYAGVLSLEGEAMREIYEKVLRWAKTNGFMSENDFEETLKTVDYNIKNIG